MALTQHYKAGGKGVKLKSGQFYRFRYSNYKNDPAPLVMFLFYTKGRNPSTGHQWNIIQCINFNYLSDREKFAFFNFYKKSIRGKIHRILGRLSWRVIEKRYPGLVPATRRYHPRFMSKIEHIDIADMPDMLKQSKYIRKIK